MGGFIGLAGAIVIGPRIGKYVNGKIHPIPAHHLPMVIAGTFILAFGLPAGVRAQGNADLDDIRKQIQELKGSYDKQIQELKDSYDTRIKALENQVKQTEEAAAKAQASASQAKETAETGSQATGLKPPASPSAFNPAISLILQGGYYNSNQNPATRSVTGFLGPEGFGLPPRGFDVGGPGHHVGQRRPLVHGQATLNPGR
jgi:hypothetical protein